MGINFDDLENNLKNNNRSRIDKVLSELLNLMVHNQAILESVMNTQRDILQKVYGEEFNAKAYHNDFLKEIKQRTPELMADFAKRTIE